MTGPSQPSRLLRLCAAAGLVAAVGVAVPAQAASAHTCFGQPVTLLGTPGDDEFQLEVGTVEVVWTGRGDDIVHGIGEDGPADDVGDYVCGGRGNDHLGDTAGDDSVRGGPGADNIQGWRGSDLLLGNRGHDLVRDDSLSSQDRADDEVRGGRGNDTVVGGWGADLLVGGPGSDVVSDIECDGPTTVVGGLGDDVLESYQSSFDNPTLCVGELDSPDVVRGDAGHDRATVNSDDALTGVEAVTVVDAR